ncbi:MAG: type II toxin-antitoxin system VapB family antitoxin [Acidobacteria bacterium]|nr:type II toxin-antitoxin system VapB family antitoxin [Acidobacteriota bacterium]
MATNLDLDPRLIEEAREAGGYKTKKEAVTAALQEFVRRRKQMKIIDLFGSIDFDPAYDYKAARQLKRSPIAARPARRSMAGRKRGNSRPA